jgi:1,4-dihydroxy-6-naphthoate synthase
MILSLAYSTDLDDAFMFWALASGRIDVHAYGFDGVSHRRADTATLNAWALAGEFDVVAVSVALVPALADRYVLLPHGGSVGRDYGPVVVAARPLERLDGLRVGVPGETTTCARLLSLAAPGATQVTVPSAPLERAFAALAAGEVDACALIHEGRLTYGERGLHLVLDLGRFWHERHHLPLPLGGNVMRRALGADAMARVSAMLHDSIAHALAHREQALDAILPERPSLTRAQADHYLSLYANADTLDWGEDGRRAIDALLGQPTSVYRPSHEVGAPGLVLDAGRLLDAR